MSEEKKQLEDLQAELETLKASAEDLAKKAQDNLAGWQRAQADYSNLKKENEKRSQELMEFANAAFMSEVLPVYNHFKLALKHIPEDQKTADWIKGIYHIQKEFQDFLKKYQIEEIKTVGEKFNPNQHEAIVHEESDGYQSDDIFEEVEPGYMLKDRVINPAKVKVAK